MGQTLSVRDFLDVEGGGMVGFFRGPFFRWQSPVDEAFFCRVGRAIVSNGIVEMDLVISVSDSFVCHSISVRYFWN